MTLLRLLSVLALLLTAPLPASPAQAERLQEQWKQAATTWSEQMEKATTPEQRATLLESRPDPAAYATRMWGLISPALDQAWSIDPAAWFLQITKGLKEPDQPTLRFAKQIEEIKKSILAHHVRRPDPQLHQACMALSSLGDSLSLSILETIERNNPDDKIQGVAALAASMIIKGLGDEGELMRKRLTYLRKAIINSADVELGGTTVAKLAENELYQIRFLSKGRVAPELSGLDSKGVPFQLTDQTGKVVILIFWSSTLPSSGHLIEFTNEMQAKFKDKPIKIIGINHDPLETLRAMRSDGSVSWRNLTDPENRLARAYRVGIWPMVYVLDHQQRIHYAGPLGSFVELTAEALAAELR